MPLTHRAWLLIIVVSLGGFWIANDGQGQKQAQPFIGGQLRLGTGDESLEGGFGLSSPPTSAGDFSCAIGTNAQAAGDASIVIGTDAWNLSTSGASVVLGLRAEDDSPSLATPGVVLGRDARSTGGVAMGAGARSDRDASARTGVAIGNDAFASSGSIAIGFDARTSSSQNIVMGRGSRATDLGGISIGYAASSTSGVALGRNASEVRAEVNGEDAIAIGTNSNADFGSIAIGDQAQGARSGVAIGISTRTGITGGSSRGKVALGKLAEVTDTADAGVAIGHQAMSTGSDGIGIGRGTVADEDSIVVGRQSTATVTRGIAIGDDIHLDEDEVARIGGTGVGLLSEKKVEVFGIGDLLTELESGKVCINESAGVRPTLTLPNASPGLQYQFVVVDAIGLEVLATGDDQIRIAGAIGTNFFSVTPGDGLELLAVSDSLWIATNILGTWQ